MVAEGGTEYGHCETIARSKSPWGPFEPCPHNPIMTHRSLNNPIQGTGHADLVQDQRGNWWLVCLAFRPVTYPPCYHLGRETFLAPVKWTDDGWPVVGDNGCIHLEMDAPLLPEVKWDQLPACDDFNDATLRMTWNFLRNPHETDWSLTERKGWLTLHGSAVSLDDSDSPAWVGRRQQHFNMDTSTLLDFMPMAENEEAGLCVRMHERNHYEIAVTLRGGKRSVIVRRRIGTLRAEVACGEVAQNPVVIGCVADQEWYRFYYVDANGVRTELAAGEVRYLSTEVASSFTGVYIALYATGNGQKSRAPAAFDWFRYDVQENTVK